VQEPAQAFVPRSADAPEGDGYIIVMVDNLDAGRNDLVCLPAPLDLPANTLGQKNCFTLLLLQTTPFERWQTPRAHVKRKLESNQSIHLP